MRLHRVISFGVMTAGVIVPAAFTAVLLSKVAATRVVGKSLTLASGIRSHRTTHASSSTSSSAGPKTFQGPLLQGPFGGVQAAITVARGRITNVSITAPQDNPTSQYINSQAAPMLKSQTLQAQSANINGVSGATVTSELYYQSLQSALKSAGR